MNLTREQEEIISASGNLKINAVAGSGKTTTVIEFAKQQPKGHKILYLAFNKSVKLEAQARFRKHGLQNVRVETAHSLAYKAVVRQMNYEMKANGGYKVYELAELLGIKGTGEKHAEYVFANHINKFTSYFCNSSASKVEELNYLDVVTDASARGFVKNNYRSLEKFTRIFLKKMNAGETPIIHDFYLKKYQLSKPKLYYDLILFDEGQDASPAMLDVFLSQEAQKVIVGDSHQQIYAWRYAVNSLSQVDFTGYHLSNSFRFGQEIAALAMQILDWKTYLGQENEVQITGCGESADESVSKATLARTNLGLLLKAIAFVTEQSADKRIYFEGNIHSYTYAEDGTSLYDVLNLSLGKKRRIKDPLIKTMANLLELEDYIDKTEDRQLAMMVEVVKEYGEELPRLINLVKERHIEGDDKGQADMVFSTVHRSKGMEYDSVQLVDDFITEKKLQQAKEKLDFEELVDAKEKTDTKKLNEEVNLLYVAVTRAKHKLIIPESLLPEDYEESERIVVLKQTRVGENEEPREMPVIERDKAYTFEEKRQTHQQAYMPWTEELDEELTVMFCEGVSVREMSAHFGRTKGAIRSRIKKLELRELYG